MWFTVNLWKLHYITINPVHFNNKDLEFNVSSIHYFDTSWPPLPFLWFSLLLDLSFASLYWYSSSQWLIKAINLCTQATHAGANGPWIWRHYANASLLLKKKKKVWVSEVEKLVIFTPFQSCLASYLHLKGVVCHSIRFRMNGSAFVFEILPNDGSQGRLRLCFKATLAFHLVLEVQFVAVPSGPNEWYRKCTELENKHPLWGCYLGNERSLLSPRWQVWWRLSRCRGSLSLILYFPHLSLFFVHCLHPTMLQQICVASYQAVEE